MQTGPVQLRDWMKRRSFNYTETADYLDLDKSVITKLANGTRRAGLTIALRIERHTGIPVEAWELTDEDESDDLIMTGARNSK